MLEKLFTSRTRVKLLTLFLMNPGKAFYVREIARATDENVNAVRRELANLEAIGLIQSERRGNAKYFQVNREMPLYHELSGMILKTEGIANVLQESLSELGVDVAFLYGSFARGTAGAESDIDLFIIGEISEEKLILLMQEVEKKLSREINYVLFTRNEFEQRKKERDPFVTNVLKEPKIMLIGALDHAG
jgi:predicted nucleotidyltransferase/predicted transcriptional regulator with HTH domain